MCLTIDEYNRILRTVGHTGTSETATAAIADSVLRFRTSRAAGGDGRQERERRSILFHDFLHIERKRFLLIIIALDIDACNGHYPVADHSSFLVDAASERNAVLRYDFKWELISFLNEGIIEEALEYFGIDFPLHECVLIIKLKHSLQPPQGACRTCPGSLRCISYH